MEVLMRPICLIFLALILGCPKAQPEAKAADESTPQDPGATVVTWDGGSLSQGELRDYLGVQLIKLEADYLTQRYEAERVGLDEMLSEKLLEIEATAGGHADVDALLKAEVTDKISEPTEEEVIQFYGVMKRRLRGQPLEQVRPMVVQEINRRAQGERFSEYLGHVREKYKVNLSLERPAIPRLPVSVDNDPSIGPEDAPITIVQFAEFQCPYCGRAKETVDQVFAAYPGKIRLVYRDYPLSFHDRAIPAAIAANCAGAQGKYFEMYDQLMSNQQSLTEADLARYASNVGVELTEWTICRADPAQAEEIQADFEDGVKLGVNGTPAFFVNGIMLSGAQPFSAFKEIIDRELLER
jgi:protein-disulfide isomerase